MRWCWLSLWLLLWLLLPASAQAHAILLASSIANQASLTVAPADLTLRFSEALEGAASGVELFNESGLDLALARPEFPEPTLLRVELPPLLRPGTYTLAYVVLSAVDGHRTTGALVFSVGTGVAPAAPDLPAMNNTPPLAVGLRFISLLTGLLLFGGVLWLLAVLLPSLRDVDRTAYSLVGRSVTLLQVALVLLLLATLADLAYRAQQIDASRAIPSGATAQTLLLSVWGMLALLRVFAAIVLVPLLFLARRSRIFGCIALCLSSLLLLSFSASGHAAATTTPALSIIGDWLHQLAGGFWLSGVLGLSGVVWASRAWLPEPRITLLVRLVLRFSALALASVVLLLLTGLLRSVNQLTQPSDLWQTAYGRLLFVKAGVVLIALMLGAWHWRRSQPQLQRALISGTWQPVRRFGLTLALESTLALAVIALTSMLVQTPHPVKAVASPQLDVKPLVIRVAPISQSAQVADLTIGLSIDDRRPGERSFSVALRDAQGAVEADRVRLRFQSLDVDIGQQIAILERQADRLYTGNSSAMSFLGRWQIEVQVRRRDRADVEATFTVEMVR